MVDIREYLGERNKAVTDDRNMFYNACMAAIRELTHCNCKSVSIYSVTKGDVGKFYHLIIEDADECEIRAAQVLAAKYSDILQLELIEEYWFDNTCTEFGTNKIAINPDGSLSKPFKSNLLSRNDDLVCNLTL